MKTRIFFLAIVLFGVLAVGCEDEPPMPDTPQDTVTPTDMTTVLSGILCQAPNPALDSGDVLPGMVWALNVDTTKYLIECEQGGLIFCEAELQIGDVSHSIGDTVTCRGEVHIRFDYYGAPYNVFAIESWQ